MTHLEALTALRDKVKAGDIDGRFDPHFERAFYLTHGMSAVYQAGDAYIGSIDAAKALHEAVLHNHQWHLSQEVNGFGYVCSIFNNARDEYCATAQHDVAARA